MNNKFSENLKKIRKEHNLSQEQLADELGVSRQAISKWESSIAYPEMDKIIALCDKFNLNIDDLLHRDIKEVKSEEESKNKINKYTDDFLKFITDTINMFSNMNLKSRIKCVLEQVIIGLVLFIISSILTNILSSLFNGIFSFLPIKAHVIISGTFTGIFSVFCFVVSVIVIIHVFKTRYLDYYSEYKNDSEVISKEKEERVEEQIPKSVKKDDRIIIRDPNHSEYKFLNALFKAIILIIKLFCLVIAFSTSCFLIGLFLSLVLSFLIAKTGLFFIGILCSITSTIIITIIVLLLLLNFIFNRKNDKKKMIWSFITSLILLGIGIGLAIRGALYFDIDTNDRSMTEKQSITLDMKDNLFVDNYDIEYVEKNIKNVVIEYEVNKFCEVKYTEIDKDGISLYSSCSNPTKIAREVIKYINKKKIVAITDEIYDITIYASKDNLKKIQKNIKNYNEMLKKNNEEINYYQDRIDELEQELEEYQEKVVDYEDQIAKLEEKNK